MTITNLNGQNLNNFVGQASSLDSPLERFRVTPKVEASGNEVKITEVALAKEDTPSETAMTYQTPKWRWAVCGALKATT
mgnify:CR=1 FL=1